MHDNTGKQRAETLHTNDVRNHLPLDLHHEHKQRSAVADEHPIEIRFMRADEAQGLAECVFNSYGRSYPSEWVYHPEAVAEKIDSGLYRSVIGVADGKIVGHAGLTLETADAKVGEAGQAVVDIRFRGHHLFTSLKRYLADQCANIGMYGMFSEATAAHPYSQKANIKLNATETGVLLGYVPNTVDYKNIDEATTVRRNSIVLFYLQTNPGHTRPMYAPPRHRAIVQRIVEHSGLYGQLSDNDGEIASMSHEAALHTAEHADLDQALITVEAYGDSLEKQVSDLVDAYCRQGMDVIYLDLPLNDPETGRVEEHFERLGFFFGGIFPNIRIDGDVLRLQYLNGIDIHADDVSTASPFGAELLRYIIAEKERHHRA